MNFDIGIWLTADLENDGAGYPRTALEKFVPANFNEIGHSINLEIHDTNPNPPSDRAKDGIWPITTQSPCSKYQNVTYNALIDWWVEWHACKGVTHDDANILLTNFESNYGVTRGDCDEELSHRCVAEASEIGRLHDETINSSGSDLRYKQMYATVLHEIGHAVIDETKSTPCTAETNEERLGYSYSDALGNIFTTPMVSWANPDHGSQNECCTELQEKPENPHFDRSYSACTQDLITNCENKY